MSARGAVATPPAERPARTPQGEVASGPEYRAFPNVERRNALQERLEVPLFAHSLGLPQGGAVLEIGCGRGVALPILHRLLRPSRLVGLDVEPAFLREAAARAADAGIVVELVEGDARALPFPTASFDLIVDFGTCYHIARPDDALREIARVLATGGIFATEAKPAQLLSHPVRTHGRRLPLEAAPGLRLVRHALLWAAYERAPARGLP